MRLQVLNHKLHSSLECALLARLDLGVAQIPTNRESMSATFPILALIPGRKLAVAEDLVGLGLGFERELGVSGAGVEEDGCFGCGEVFLQVSRCQSGGREMR